MNDNSSDDKVKQKYIPFPVESSRVGEGSPYEEIGALKERIAQLEVANAGLLNTVATLSSIIAGRESRPEVKVPIEAPKPPESRPLPEEDKMLNRVALCSELVKLITGLIKETVPLPTPKLWTGSKGKSRVYLVEDSSYLYFDEQGRICAANPKTKKSSLAIRTLKILYQLGDALPSPVILSALAKSEYNAGLLKGVKGLP